EVVSCAAREGEAVASAMIKNRVRMRGLAGGRYEEGIAAEYPRLLAADNARRAKRHSLLTVPSPSRMPTITLAVADATWRTVAHRVRFPATTRTANPTGNHTKSM